ncbi:MAG: LysR family transcriptional regulator [Alphaproteobacteria bacterium]|nr:MAG: LysR family transcriptional regulator [Alphaproteobacteria bacterium]
MAELNYHHLRYFHAIVEAGGLTKAAARLNVSPSALSVQVQQLEAQLGHKLFDRIGRQLVLTEAGRIALDSAETIFGAGQELVSALKGAGGTKRTSMRIGALATLSRNFQVAFLKPLVQRKDVHIVVRSGGMRDLMAMLDAHHIDVLLTNTLPPRDETSSWVAHLIGEQEISLVGPPRPRGRKQSLTTMLAREPLIVPTRENHLRGDFDALAERLGVEVKIAAEVDDMAMLRLLTREGFGFGVAPLVVVRDELDVGVLTEYGVLPGLKESFFAISPTRRFPNLVVGSLVKAAAPTPGRSGLRRRG